jgi:hypothetical protein
MICFLVGRVPSPRENLYRLVEVLGPQARATGARRALDRARTSPERWPRPTLAHGGRTGRSPHPRLYRPHPGSRPSRSAPPPPLAPHVRPRPLRCATTHRHPRSRPPIGSPTGSRRRPRPLCYTPAISPLRFILHPSSFPCCATPCAISPLRPPSAPPRQSMHPLMDVSEAGSRARILPSIITARRRPARQGFCEIPRRVRLYGSSGSTPREGARQSTSPFAVRGRARPGGGPGLVRDRGREPEWPVEAVPWRP